MRTFSVAHQIISDMRHTPRPEGDIETRFGGNLVFWHTEQESPIFSARIHIPDSKGKSEVSRFESFYTNSMEKACRLSKQNAATSKVSEPPYISAWQSRDFNAKKYGGGILTQGKTQVAIAFSGFCEHDDEYLVTELAYRLNLINFSYAHEIFEISKNPWAKLFKKRD
jgi:hypothetical protein